MDLAFGLSTSLELDGHEVEVAETGPRAGYDGHRWKRDTEVHLAVDTPGQLLTVLVTPANEQERARVGELAEQVQVVTGENVGIAFVDQGYTGPEPQAEAAEQGIRLEVVRFPEAKKGFVPLPKRWSWSGASPG